ncbi:MAG: SRPBCC family protein [Solirubrobacterales bacterium]
MVRRRRLDASPAGIWRVVSDPHHLPRWWPETKRVENVSGEGEELTWTQVLGTRGGRGVRADYRCVGYADGERFDFEQTVTGTPFEKHLRGLEIEVALTPGENGTTEVSLARDMRLRGISRLGSPLMRRGSGRILEEALEGLANVTSAS